MPIKVSKETEERLLTRAEVAEMFQVCPSTVRRWAEAGKLPSVKTLGGHHRYDARAVMALVKHLMKEETTMENVLFDVPAMYADHHVIAVRQALLSLPGVDDVWASSAWQQVQVTYNPAAVSPADLGRALEQAGYPVSDGSSPPAPAPATLGRQAGPHAKDLAWDALGARVTRTNQADLAMSGEFRRY